MGGATRQERRESDRAPAASRTGRTNPLLANHESCSTVCVVLNPVHHIELWTTDVAACAPAFDWLLPQLGWAAVHSPDWEQGRSWHHPSGSYIVLEQSPAVAGPHDRMRAGLNHLALRVHDRPLLDQLRRECTEHGWRELFADQYPHAGGPQHTALFIENAEGFEIEVVAG